MPRGTESGFQLTTADEELVTIHRIWPSYSEHEIQEEFEFQKYFWHSSSAVSVCKIHDTDGEIVIRIQIEKFN